MTKCKLLYTIYTIMGVFVINRTHITFISFIIIYSIPRTTYNEVPQIIMAVKILRA